jgi:hypothetical protein
MSPRWVQEGFIGGFVFAIIMSSLAGLKIMIDDL